MQILQNLNIDFMRRSKIAVGISVSLIVVSIILLATRGLNFGIDFTGGYLLEVGYPKSADLNQIRQKLADNGVANASVQHFGTTQDVLIRLAPTNTQRSADEADLTAAGVGEKLLAILQQDEPEVSMRRVEYVGSQVGEELQNEGGLAMLLALICVMIYVMFRFEKRLALSAVLALIHDVIITLGILSLLQSNFDLTVLAALLAVIGYSLNDTIVVFDRIRENFRKLRLESPVEVANISINETLSRTVVTSLTTVLVMVALFVFGGELIHVFAFTLIIGIIIGTYSSIFIASPAALALGLSRDDLLIVKPDKVDENP